jgi:hypothetical protein
MKKHVENTQRQLYHWWTLVIDFFSNAIYWLDSKVNPVFGKRIYELSKWTAQFLFWVGLPLMIIILASLYANPAFTGGNWSMVNGSYIVTVVSGTYVAITAFFYFLWFWFSKFSPNSKNEI